MEERGNFACKLPLWGFLWPVWGRSAWLANQKANRWPPSMRLRQTLKQRTCFPTSGLLFPSPHNHHFPFSLPKCFFSLYFLTSNCVKITLVNPESRNLSDCILPRNNLFANTLCPIFIPSISPPIHSVILRPCALLIVVIFLIAKIY